MRTILLICATFLATFSTIRAQSSALLKQLNDINEIRSEMRRFDLDRDYFFDAVNNAIPSIIRSGLSETTGDVSLVIRFATMLNLARFDANAPYTATAIGITTKLPRRPFNEWTLKNKNLACMYAGYRVLLSVIPKEMERIRQMMEDLGLNPDDNHEDQTTPIGIGNLCGNNVVRDRLGDGINQLGDENGVTYNRNPYTDYTNYQPVNTAYKLVDPSRWQPGITTKGDGKFFVQHFVTPQNGLVKPYSFTDVNQYEVGPHGRILNTQYDITKYKETVDEVIRVSANLNDERKLKAEFYEDKVKSVGGSIYHAIQRRGFGIDEFCQMELISNMAMFDVLIIVWKEKRRWDAVRPVTAIRFLYGDQPITAWGGPFKGTVQDIPGTEWTSYLPVANHPEYPSASTGACVTHAEAMKLFLGSDELDWDVTFARGESRIEPGYLPSRNQTYKIKTFSQIGNECGQSRLWAGVHFQDAIDVIKPIAKEIAQKVVVLVTSHFNAEPEGVTFYAEPAAPLTIHELPAKNPYKIYQYPASTNPGPSRFYPRAAGPQAAALPFANHYSFSFGKK